MRLICPNCSAQYEIDASLIPDEGRDVQCSNCGHTWFELPPAPPAYADLPEPEPAAQEEEPAFSDDTDEETAPVEADENRAEDEGWEREDEDRADEEPAEEDEGREPFEEADAEPETAALAEPETEPEPDEDEEPEDEIEPSSQASDDTGDDDDEPEDTEEPSMAARAIAAATQEVETGAPLTDPFAAAAAAGAAFQKRRPADVAALDILREEAERELTQRRTPPATTPLETQTDMAFNEGAARSTTSRALRARMARESASDTGKTGKKDARVQSAEESYEAPRRDLLPDIDEINSSLKSRRGREQAAPDSELDRRKGFRAGFLLMILLTVLLIFAYAWAPALARAVPALEGPLLVYVDLANSVRDWIDGLIGGA